MGLSHLWMRCANDLWTDLLFLCRLRSIVAHRDHFVRRVCRYVRLTDSHTFLVVTLFLQVTHSFVSQATNLDMLPFWCFNILYQKWFFDMLQVHTFSLLRQEYPPILTSGEMLSHPGGWDKPIPEVIHLWRHRTSTPNNLEKTYFAHFRTRMRKIIKHHIEGCRESHPRVQDLLHPRLGKPRRGLQILDTRMGFPRPSLNVVLDSINLALCVHYTFNNYLLVSRLQLWIPILLLVLVVGYP